MYVLFDLFWEICLLRKGPQDVPSSWALLKLALAAYAVSSLLFLLAFTEPFKALLQALLDAALLVALTYGLLSVMNYKVRFVQTLTTLAGTGALLSLIAWPLALWMAREAAADGGGGLAFLLFVALLVWTIAVMAHVLHHALSTSRWMGLLYTLGYLFVSVIMADLFFPRGV